MVFLPVIYYGKRGLESDILQSYLRLSGFEVDIVVLPENGPPPSEAIPNRSIVVISDSSPEGARELARTVARRTGECAKVFIIDSNPHDGDLDGEAEVVCRPYQLTELVKRIRSYSRNHNS